MIKTDLRVYKQGWDDCVTLGYNEDKFNHLKYPDMRDQYTYWQGWSDAKQKIFSDKEKALEVCQ